MGLGKKLDINPLKTTHGSHKKAWWKCEIGLEWQATIADRNSGSGCPYCVGQKVLKSYNDLQNINPTLATEWNYQRNSNLRPDACTASSNEKVWWKCSKGHEWKSSINHRSRGNGCPYCSGKKLLMGYNDLQTKNPTLAAEWNYEKMVL